MRLSRRLSYKEVLELKKRLLRKLSSELSPASLKRAKRDPHSFRVPRPCGLTVHSGVGCPNACVYCYIQDMGFRFKGPKPYSLKGKELVLALLMNPYFIPGIWGTYLSFGSITDPFIGGNKEKSFEYMEHISKVLGNPVQFSTKAPLSNAEARRLRSLGIPISPLITIVTLEKWRLLEPRAPSPQERLEAIKILSREGLKPFLFLRPIMPGINDDEVEDIITEAKRYGALGVVIGGFRVTENIILRLKKRGFEVDEIIRRTGKISSRRQVSLRIWDLKREALEAAKEKGLVAVLSACCAMTIVLNKEGYEVPCANVCFIGRMCTNDFTCGNCCLKKLPRVEEDDLKEALSATLGIKNFEFDVEDGRILVMVEDRIRVSEGILRFLATLYRRRVFILGRGGGYTAS